MFPSRAFRPLLARSLLLAAAAPALRPTSAPGAGFALLGSFWSCFITTILIVHCSRFSSGPFARWRGASSGDRSHPSKPWIKRLIIVGLRRPGPEAHRAVHEERASAEHEEARGEDPGCYQRSSEPPTRRSRPSRGRPSPPATNPARHNIFDFLDRDRKTTYRSSRRPTSGAWNDDQARSPTESRCDKPEVRLLRKSKPFWSILGEHNIWSTVLRVPITFPPDKFYGAQLSAMCVPDLLGTQGTFLFYTTRPADEEVQGRRLRFQLDAQRLPAWRRRSQGPENLFRDGNPPLEVPLAIDRSTVRPVPARHESTVDGEPVELDADEAESDWIP